ncbi:MAG: hypothetical protein ABI347_01770 [Nitrososphaera sp.]|jgi:hypothetical protein
MIASRKRLDDRTFVIVALVGCMAAFALLFALISGGAVRHVNIFLPEKTENTLAFRQVDGDVALVGIKGIAQANPTLIMRTGDYVMELTIINEDDKMHILFIDGMNVSTKVLRPGDGDVITLRSAGEATYNYYDWGAGSDPLGQIRAIRVTQYE